MATSWGSHVEPTKDDVSERRRVGYRVSSAIAVAFGAGGEATVRLTETGHRLAEIWNGARVPFLALVAIVVAQVPLGRATAGAPEPETERPPRSELARHLDRHRRRNAD